METSPHKKLRCWFHSWEQLELDKIECMHPLIGSRILARGRQHLPSEYINGSLPWTSAVKALAILLVRTAASNEDTQDFKEGAKLSSDTTQAARSLDYALSKKPAWLQDLFSVDAAGSSLAARFFIRQNSESKRPGPVIISLNDRMISGEDIEIYVKEKKIDCVKQQSKLAEHLLSVTMVVGEDSQQPKSEVFQQGKSAKDFSARMRHLILAELQKSFSITDTFSRVALEQAARHLKETRLFSAIAGPKVEQLKHLLEYSTPRIRMGLVEETSALKNDISKSKQLTVCVSAITVGALAILHCMKDRRNILLDIHCCYPSGIEIARGIIEQTLPFEPDICIAATPSAAEIMNSKHAKDYTPIMLLPRHTHRVLSSVSDKQHNFSGSYGVHSENPSGSLFYYEALKKQGLFTNQKANNFHCDSDDCLYYLHQGDKDFRTILWFPLGELAIDNGYARAVDDHTTPLGQNWIFLLAHRRLIEKKPILQTFMAEVYHAWHTLRNDSEVRESIVQSLLEDSTYYNNLYRAAGGPVHEMFCQRG